MINKIFLKNTVDWEQERRRKAKTWFVGIEIRLEMEKSCRGKALNKKGSVRNLDLSDRIWD